MKLRHMAAALAVSGLAIISFADLAGAVTERQKRDCRNDYNRFCKDYKLGTEGLRACMSRSIKSVSNRCINALVAGGDMTKAQADRIRRQRSAKR